MELLNIPRETQKSHTSKVDDLIDNFSWHMLNVIETRASKLVEDILLVIIPKQLMHDDYIIWKESKDGYLTSKQAYQFLYPHYPVAWSVKIWHDFIPPSSSFIVWIVLHKKCLQMKIFKNAGVLWL